MPAGGEERSGAGGPGGPRRLRWRRCSIHTSWFQVSPSLFQVRDHSAFLNKVGVKKKRTKRVFNTNTNRSTSRVRLAATSLGFFAELRTPNPPSSPRRGLLAHRSSPSHRERCRRCTRGNFIRFPLAERVPALLAPPARRRARAASHRAPAAPRRAPATSSEVTPRAAPRHGHGQSLFLISTSHPASLRAPERRICSGKRAPS